MKKHILNTRYIAVVLILTGLTAGFIYTIYANPDGRTGRTSTLSGGCGSCHGSSPTAAVTPSVVSGSGSFTVAPNSTTSFTVTVTTTDLSKSIGGLNLGVKTDQTGNPGTNAGTLTAGTGLTLINSELTHSTPKNLSGGSTSWNFTWTAPSTPGTYYMRVLAMTANGNGTNDAGDTWNWMTVQTITVASTGTVTLTSPNGGEDICAGMNKNITWTSSGISTVRLELSSDGGVTYPTVLVDNYNATPGNWVWAVPANQNPGSSYMVRVLDALNYTTRDASNSTFTIHAKTAITAHPVDLDLCAGSTAVFSVTATGENLLYSWMKNGYTIPNETTRSLYLNNISSADEGNYSCLVQGLCDSLSSTVAKLTIKAPPSIVTQPKNDTVCVGSPATISVAAAGVALNYSWSRNGITIPGSNTSEIVINNVTRADSGTYECVVSGACLPKVTTSKALLMVYSHVTITQQPTDKSVTEGDSVVIDVSASGTNLSYQWRKKSIPLTGKTSQKLVIYNATPADSGSYDCVISNRCGQMITKTITLTVAKPNEPQIELALTNVDFGTVGMGQTKDTLLAGEIRNISKADVIINSIMISGKDAADFNFFGITLPVHISPGESLSLNVEFVPSSTGAKSATINFSTNAKNVVSISLIGFAVNADYELTATDWDYGTVIIGQSPISENVIKNIGTTEFIIQAPKVLSYDSLNFKLLDAEKYPVTLKQDSSFTVNFMFVPTIAKSYSVDVIVPYNGLKTLQFKLSGNGIINSVDENIANQITISPNPASDYIEITASNVNLSQAKELGVTIYDLLGVEVISGIDTPPAPSQEGVRLDVSQLSPGMYFVRVGDVVRKFVKM